MKVYKLIKTYPFSQNLGYIFNENNYPKSQHNKDMIYSINKYPEFWEEIEEKMTLKEKLCKPFGGLKTETVNELEQIADDFAIGFADWYLKKSEKYDSYLKLKNDTKKLLEIYKKEKL